MPEEVKKRYTVAQKGIGKPDYSSTISSGLERAGIRLKYRQQVKIFALLFSDRVSPFAWVRSPLAPGASTHLINQETGLAMPYTLAAGYALSLVSRRSLFSQDNRFELFLDDFLAMGGDNEGGIPYYEEDVLAFSTILIDPTASSAHTIDSIFTNLGTTDLYGGATGLSVIEAIATPAFPTTKTTKCPFCGNEEVQPVTATGIICSACSKLYIVLDLSGIKGSPS